MFESTLDIGDLYNMLHPNVRERDPVIMAKMKKVFDMFGIGST
jgi:hypothetical protein